MELYQFLIDFVTLLDDGDQQCVIIKFIEGNLEKSSFSARFTSS